MKKLFVVTSLLMVFVLAPMAMADQVQIGYIGSAYGKYQTGSGGEFTLNPVVGLNWIINLYDSKAKNVGTTGTFQTFCIEKLETISGFPSTYAAVLNDNAIYGGNSGQSGDPISVGTAWLYHEFQLGRLQGYDYTTDAGRHASADALQKTIWWLEGEAGNPNNFYSQLIVDSNHFGSAAAAMANNFLNGQRQIPVMALNLWDIGHVGELGHQHQDQLVCVPVPEPATMLLLGSGLIGLAGLARRKFKK